MLVFRYDHSFEGLLTAVFDAYSRREFPERLIAAGEPAPMFAISVYEVITERTRADRVWAAFENRLPARVCNMMMHVWLSELSGSDELLFRYMRKIIDSDYGSYDNFADVDIAEAHKIAIQVSREGEHVRQFIRFQKAADGSYFAPVEPKFNALPLAIEYLKDRFADQTWLVYDVKRRYGYYYDRRQVREITMEDDSHLLGGRLGEDMMAADEKQFQDMWRAYFKSATIKERSNPRLQRQHMPRRFWKFLTEKQ